MKFVNREQELKFLNHQYHSKKSELVVIYGRRRAGKTTLIEEFIKGKPALYYLSDLQKQEEQIDDLRKILADYFKDNVLQTITMTRWDQVFEYITEKLKISKQKIVLVIDEYTYLHQSNKAIASIIQKYWDTHWSKTNQLLLILCGSFLGMMERATLYYTSPLYGRTSGQIKLAPFSFKNFIQIYPQLPLEKQVEFYTVVGGTPRYALEFNPQETVFQNIEKNFLNPNSFIYNDPTLLLSQEFTKTNTYFSILKTIAEGNHKIGHIASRLGMRTNELNTYIDKLMVLNLVTREAPVTEAKAHKSKKGLYFINDNLFRFWFKFVLPNKSYLELGDTAKTMEQIKKELSLLAALTFENVCRELMRSSKIVPFHAARWGKWWDKKEEIDVVGINDETKEILFGECKWQNSPIGLGVLKDLEQKASLVQWLMKHSKTSPRKEYFAVFSKKGFEPKLIAYAKEHHNVLLLTLKDLIG